MRRILRGIYPRGNCLVFGHEPSGSPETFEPLPAQVAALVKTQERQSAEISEMSGDLKAIRESLKNLEKQNDRILGRMDSETVRR